MNIPLNIDWQQIFLHLLNFAILTLGLYLLLYNPVKKFMDEREEYYKKQESDSKEKIKKAEELEDLYRKRLEDVDKVIEERKALAAQKAKKAADALIKNAKEQATKILLDAREAAEREKAKILEDTQQEITYMAMAATEKLLAQSATGALDEFLAIVKKE